MVVPIHAVALITLMVMLLTCASPAHSATPPGIPPLEPALAAHAPASLLPADLQASAVIRNEAESDPPATLQWTDGVLRVETFNNPKYADHVSVGWKLPQPFKKGEVLLLRFQARALSAKQESGEAMFEARAQQSKPQFTRHVNVPLSVGPEWSTFDIPFELASDAEPGEIDVRISFGTIPQAMEIASPQLLNFAKRASVAQLPQTRFTYLGREAGAAWRESALKRIEQIRTAPITVRVVDAAGKPISGATVRARLVRPAFLWGTEVDSNWIISDTPDGDRYRKTVLELFDTAVIGNNMKWPLWSGSVASREKAIRAADWITSNGLRMRGHVLVWPGDKFSPRRVQQMPPPREALPAMITEHIRDLVTTTRGQIVGWDVVNEMMHERDYFKTMPEETAVEWFKVAREHDPAAKLFINDYQMLNSRKSPEVIRQYVDLIKRLISAGAPIDGAGVQGHFGRQVRNPEDVLRDLDLLATAGVEIQITEFDINTLDEQLQADYERDFMIALYSHPSVTGFTRWGFWQRAHWKPDAAMFRADWTEKPNAAVFRDLMKQWRTELTLTTDASGVIETRGHLGEYQFDVQADDKSARQMRVLTREGGTYTIQFP